MPLWKNISEPAAWNKNPYCTSTSDVPCVTTAARSAYSPRAVNEPDARAEHRYQPHSKHFLLQEIHLFGEILLPS